MLQLRNGLELLAPAGNWEALEAAVNSGADAVYLGGRSFGARAYADNFDRDELTRAVRFAHLRDVKIYVTVNTLVDDSEMEDLADYLIFLSNSAVDAIIVQDMGVARLARRVVPDLPLHASTQMTVTNSAGVRFAAKNGIVRVVPARELTLAELKSAAEQGVEIEAFVHGALCVCYSGQCLMSSLIGGRSGNRGGCAQPCRMPYTLEDAQGRNVLAGRGAGPYLLSPKDLNTIDLLPRLIESGVCSFKIEGRMKRPEYVAVVTGVYRRAIDSWLRGKYGVSGRDRRDLEQIFSRGFTTAYLNGNQGKDMMSDGRPDNRGAAIGKVARVLRSRGRAVLRLEGGLRRGDGLEFSSKSGVSVGMTVTALERDGRRVTEAAAGTEVCVELRRGVREGMSVYRTQDADLTARAAMFFGQRNARRVPVHVSVTARLGSPLEVVARDARGRCGRGVTSFAAEKALSRPLDEQAVRALVGRLGTTAYALDTLSVSLDEGIIVPASEINEARRRACQELDCARLNSFPSERRRRVEAAGAISPPRTPVAAASAIERPLPSLSVWVDTAEKARASLEEGADWIVFGGECFAPKALSPDDYAQTAELAHRCGKKCAFGTPRAVKETEMDGIAELCRRLPELGADALCVHNAGVWQQGRELGVDVPLWADMSLNIFNSQSLFFWKENGASGATLSAELNLNQITRLATAGILPVECHVHGPAEMMVSQHCVGGSRLGGVGRGACSFRCREELFLVDRRGARFPLRGDQYCRMHVFNSRPHCLLDSVTRLTRSGVSRLRVDARTYGEDEVRIVVRNWRAALDGRRFETPAPGTFTHGHFNRGVLGPSPPRAKPQRP